MNPPTAERAYNQEMADYELGLFRLFRPYMISLFARCQHNFCHAGNMMLNQRWYHSQNQHVTITYPHHRCYVCLPNIIEARSFGLNYMNAAQRDAYANYVNVADLEVLIRHDITFHQQLLSLCENCHLVFITENDYFEHYDNCWRSYNEDRENLN